jgi:hypothetical protein
MADEARLEIIEKAAGRNGTVVLTVKFGDEYLLTDEVHIAKAAARAEFVEKLCADRPGLPREAVVAELERIAGRKSEGRKKKAVDGGKDEASGSGEDELYTVVRGCLCRSVATRDGGAVTIPMCNFDARIVEEIARDDGVEQARRLAVDGTLGTGEPLPSVTISTEEFGRGDWPLIQWGARAVVFAGQGNRDHLRAAIQIRSADAPRRTVYAHTGWRRIEGTWFYLHAGGAIGPDGPLGGITVELPDALSRYHLPDPPEGEARRAAVRASLGLARGLAPDRVAMPLLATVCRSVLPDADASTHFSGRTGSFKTELAALAQQHWGPGMDARHLPANWSSTANALEAIGFAAKDAALVVDDFCPTGSQADISRYHRDADRLFRAQGNRSGRLRARPDGTARPEKPPRGMFLSTGEDVPRGHSLRARLLIVEVGRDDVDADRLTECQRDGAAGLYAAALAGYARHLAGRFDDTLARFRAEAARLREEIAAGLGEAKHRRTPTLVADLIVAFDLFLEFAREAGAIDDAERDELAGRCRAALLDVGADQAAAQQAADPCDRYLALLASILSSGRAHLAAPNGDRPASSPGAFGWRSFGDPTDLDTSWQPQGRRMGWIDGGDVYLDSEAAYAEAQALAGIQGDSLAVGRETLHKRLHERRLLASVDERRGKLLVRRSLGGGRPYVLHLRAALVLQGADGGPTGPGGPNGENPGENGPNPRAYPGNPPENRPTKKAQEPGENGAEGPDGPVGPAESTPIGPGAGRKRKEVRL